MELKEGCEKYADGFILKAYNNGGEILEEDNSFSEIPHEYKSGASTLLSFYGTLKLESSARTYTLNKEGMEFARKGAFSGTIKRENDERKQNRQTRNIAIAGLIVAAIVAMVQVYTMLKGLCR